MKAILFICLAFIFYSCKTDIDLGNVFGNITLPPFTFFGDSTAKVKADISGPTSWHLSTTAFGTTFNRYKWSADSTVINIGGQDSICSIQMQLTNIVNPGTYSFGTVSQYKREATMSCKVGLDYYANNRAVLSGTLSIDTLLDHHIHGIFSVTCFKGTQQVVISNGSFVGNY